MNAPGAAAHRWVTTPDAYPESFETNQLHSGRTLTTPSGHAVHIDTRMVETVTTLWNAGIGTLFSCGGGAPNNPHRTKERHVGGQ